MTRRDLHDVTERAISLALIGFSASDATALAVMGKRMTCGAIARVESIVSAVLARKLRGAA
jgi:hypothetical protein